MAAFKERLIEEQLIATGYSNLAIERVRIPGERWRDLWPGAAIARTGQGESILAIALTSFATSESGGGTK